MRLQELLNKISNEGFLLTVNGWCEELRFCEYEDEKKEDYWQFYKNCKIRRISLLTTNGLPELYITIDEPSFAEEEVYNPDEVKIDI